MTLTEKIGQLQLLDWGMCGADKTGVFLNVNVDAVASNITDDLQRVAVEDIAGSVTRPIRELKGFKKVSLIAGDSKTVSFTLHTDALACHNSDMQRVTEPGDFTLWIAAHAQKGLAAKFEVTAK